jgi:hypothetical protein
MDVGDGLGVHADDVGVAACAAKVATFSGVAHAPEAGSPNPISIR